MKAIVLHDKHQPLSFEEKVDIPVIGQGEALVKLKAAALNRRDFWIQKGLYAGLKFPIILGSDGSGTVELVGDEWNDAWIGKEVIINPSFSWGEHEAYQGKDFNILGLPQDGTFAEYVKVPLTQLYEKPAHLSFQEAAALPLAGLTSWRALFVKGKLQKGERVLVVGIGSGVASFALLWAVKSGAEVYVTSSKKEKIDKAIEMGALGGVLYTDDDWADQLRNMAEGGFDVIIDGALGNGFAKHIDLANPGCRIVFFGGTASGDLPVLNARKIFWKQISILGTTMGSPADFEAMLSFVNRYQVRPVIDSVYPLKDAELAVRLMDSGNQFGKIILKIAE
ncbi:zinc-binding dehydrogenase [Olivibacter sitiensis]|uniref:zinc-binding dehydrogenase n=1 Tax=Olivibacter sitiensis TaxID=376470 RepID=UPI00041BB706|nr:zinc-binding dehydrogenase [Olivibacter sitiensis]